MKQKQGLTFTRMTLQECEYELKEGHHTRMLYALHDADQVLVDYLFKGRAAPAIRRFHL